MLKSVIKYFFIIFLFSVIGVWVSNNKGIVEIYWLGYQIKTSVFFILFL